MIMAFFAAVADFGIFVLARRFFGKDTGRMALLATSLSSFNFIYSTRPLSNSIEMTLTILAVLVWPWIELSGNPKQPEKHFETPEFWK
jgi:phosphatidylinositol glycan class B